MPAPPPARLHLLGGFVLVAGDVVLPLGAPAQRVLAFLALHARARPVPRRLVAERLWGESTAQRAASSLRSALWRVPEPGGAPLVASTASTLALAPGVEVDLWAAQDRVLALAGGTARDAPPTEDLDELTTALLPEWSEDWLLVAQETHRQGCLHALEQACADLCAAGRHTEAVRVGLAAVACEPLRESAHRRVIEVHLAEGNHAEALRQYQSFRRLVADGLGLPPSPAIRRLVGPLLGRPVDDGARTASVEALTTAGRR